MQQTAWTATESRALRSVAAQFFVNGAVFASFIPRLPEIRDRIGADLAAIGTVLAIATLGGLLGSALVGRASARFTTKQLMIGGSLGVVFLLPIIGLTSAPWHLLLVLGAMHIADVVTDVAMNVQGSNLSSRRSAPVMNRLHAMWSIGTVVGGVISAAMAAATIDIRLHLVGASTILLVVLVLVSPGLLPDDTEQRRAAVERGDRLPVRPLVFFAILGATAIVPEVINSDWAAFRMTDDLDASAGLAGLGFVAFTSGMVTGRLLGDTAVARIGNRLLLRRATIVAALGVATATLVPSVGAVFVGLAIAGLGISVMFPQLYDAAAQSGRSGSSLGALTAGSRIGLLAAPAAVGWLAQGSFTVGAAIAVVTIPALIAVLLLSPRPAGASLG